MAGNRAIAKRIGLCVVAATDGATATVLAEVGGEEHVVPVSSINRRYDSGHVLVSETSDFRSLAASQLRPTDVVVEIGSSYGRATNVLSKHCAKVIGIDTSLDLVQKARQQYPALDFRQFDVLAEPHLLASVAHGCTVCFLDIGGNRDKAALVRAVPLVHRVLRPRLVCIKSRELFAAASQHAQGRGGLAGTRVPGGVDWWAALCAQPEAHREAKRYHNANCEVEGGSRFTKYPLRFVPASAPDGRRICRFHNYGVCTKGDSCNFDHHHCHHCLARGHIAKNCTADGPSRKAQKRTGPQASGPATGCADTPGSGFLDAAAATTLQATAPAETSYGYAVPAGTETVTATSAAGGAAAAPVAPT
eukprot:CAMPEP_0185165108 /NCGR_PEP_ID=MMETSP1139-20130426/10436_1 /TAXON_ID=298111 /ORGANISM="Pavlova sp., Strain CCMP459" /LENGTH=361 /DNA_ID=CAMNT_0027730501 /DNA_START=69 /DNA_END=1151 /DNA_ORIENTATION=+